MSRDRPVSAAEARRIAKSAGVKLPRVGYEMSLGNGRWISSAGHSDFGFFDKPKGTKPFSIKCRCEDTSASGETLRPWEKARACPIECPNAPPAGVTQRKRSKR